MEPAAEPAANTFQPPAATISIDEAAARIGVAPSTVRRWVKAGRFRSARVLTKQGHAFRVSLEDVEAAAPSTAAGMVPAAEPATNGSSERSTPPTMAPSVAGSVERSAAMADYNAKLVQPWADQVERLTGRLEALAREHGDMAAEVRWLRAELAKRDEPEPPRRWWAFWR